MIPISQIDPQLSIYKDKKVVIFGAGHNGTILEKLFQSFGVELFCFCDNNRQKWGTTFRGYPVISPKELEALFQKEGAQILVQVSVEAHDVALQQQALDMGIQAVISYRECACRLVHYCQCGYFQKYPEHFHYKEEIIGLREAQGTGDYEKTNPLLTYQHQVNFWDKLGIFICMMQKTGNTSLTKTFSHKGVFFFQSHMPKAFHKPLFTGEKIKIITAIRDPIARDISDVYFRLTIPGTRIFSKQELNAPNDAQVRFDAMMEAYQADHSLPSINAWFTDFKEQFVDLLAHPFDKEGGYTIIEEEQYEIFFFQLEKLNDIIPALSQWVGVPFDKLERENVAADKWIASSYKQAQKELTFTKEYFDLCYNDPYIRHCYSEADLQAFQDKWKNQVK